MKKGLQFIDDLEKQAEAQLLDQFRKQVGLFEQGIDILTHTVTRIGLRPEGVKHISLEEVLASGDAELIRSTVVSDVLAEFMFRLWASRRLLRSGYLSRTLACLRDAFEALECSDICRRDVKQATRWIRGHRIQLKGLGAHPEISRAYDLLYRWLCQAGVHAYSVAADTSKVYFTGRMEGDEIVRRGGMATILVATNAFIDYFLGAYDDFLREERGLRSELRRVSVSLYEEIRKLSKETIRAGNQPKIARPKNEWHS